MSFMRKGFRQSQRKKVGSFIKNHVPKGKKGISLELREGKEYIKKYLKYNPMNPQITPEEHFDQDLRYVFYNEDEDYNYTINYNHSWRNEKTDEEVKEDKENMKYCHTSTPYNLIKMIKEQQMSKGKVDDILVKNTDYLLTLYLETLIVPSLILMNKEKPILNPPISLFEEYKQMRGGEGDYTIRFKKEGTKINMTLNSNPNMEDGDDVPYVERITSKTGLTRKEFEESIGV